MSHLQAGEGSVLHTVLIYALFLKNAREVTGVGLSAHKPRLFCLSVAFFCEGERGEQRGGAYQSMLKCFSVITAPAQASREGGGIFHVLAEASLEARHHSARHLQAE